MYNPLLGANGEWFFCLERLPERSEGRHTVVNR